MDKIEYKELPAQTIIRNSQKQTAYKIRKRIGRGGFGVTYLAENMVDSTLCVVKQLLPSINSPRVWNQAKKRFYLEAQTLAKLGNHPQIPTLIDHFEDHQGLYLVQEFVEGEEIKTGNYKWTEKEIVYFLDDILGVLDFVHQQGVIHRDIKPSNLLRRKGDNRIFLIDFGAVKEIQTLLISGDSKDNAPYTNVIGTPWYMSPEQTGGKPLFCSDIYSLGKTLIYLLTGEEIETNITNNYINGWQKWVEKNHQVISEKLISIINKMIAENSAQRYCSVREIKKDITPLFLLGEIIGNHYQVIGHLGGSDRKNTYLAKNLTKQEDSLCVIKKSYLSKSAIEIETRLNKELTIFQQLEQKSSMSQLLTYFEEEDQLYIVEEYLRGNSLEQEVKIYKHLTELEVSNLLESMLKILAPIHGAGLIHLNLKPSNIIRKQDGQFCLTDFGFVKKITCFNDTETDFDYGEDLGKDGYISPEQIRGNPSFRSDIYSLGIIAIHALTGKEPTQLLSNPKTGELTWRKEVNVSDKLAYILDRMTNLDINKRYLSCQEVLNDLQKKAPNKPSLNSLFKNKLYPAIIVSLGFFIIIIFGGYTRRLNQASFFFQQGDINLETQQYNLALKFYKQGLENLPPFANLLLNIERAWLQKAAAFSGLKNYQAMLESCQKAMELNPNSISARICQGIALQKLGRYDQAINIYEEAKQIDPNNFEVWHNLGLFYLEIDQESLGIEHLKKAMELGKEKSFVTWNDLGQFYYQKKQYDLAINAYEQGINLNPNYIPAWLGLGNTQNTLTQYQSALNSYQKVIDLDEQNAQAWYGKGLAYEGLKQYQNAFDCYDKAIMINPKYSLAMERRKRVMTLL
jgi:serine/threonine protein kinase/Flp pilus assembly protein TadD